MSVKHIAFIIIIFACVSTHAQSYHKDDVDKAVLNYTKEGNYVSASNLLVDYAIFLEKNKDTSMAFEYQSSNIKLIDAHLDYFLGKGLSWEDYFANYYVTTSLASWIGKKEKSLSLFVSMLQKMKDYAPHLLPYYSSSLSYIFRTKDYVYGDSVYMFQNTLDVIKKMAPTAYLVGYYIKCNEVFLQNRLLNSLDGTVFVIDKMSEAELWFNQNKDYIDQLNPVVYKEDIQKFYLDYCDLLFSLASCTSSQKNDVSKAIDIYFNELDVLALINASEEVQKRKMSCYMELVGLFYQIGNTSMMKHYLDIAYPLFFECHNSLSNWETYRLLSSMANAYFAINNWDLSSNLQGAAIKVRAEFDPEPHCSDYSLYLLYSTNDTLEVINIGEKLVDEFGIDEPSMSTVFDLLGSAYSKKMRQAIIKNNHQERKYYQTKADSCFSNAEKVIQKHSEYNTKYHLTSNATSGYINGIALHYARQGKIQKALELSKKALHLFDATPSINQFFNIVNLAASIKDSSSITEYLPQLYTTLVSEIKTLLPLLGSTEGETFLRYGDHPLYQMYEWSKWLPNDSLIMSTLYDVALQSKGIMLQYSSFPQYIGKDTTLNKEYCQLVQLRDSIYKMPESVNRVKLLLQYQQNEQTLRKKILPKIEEPLKVSWYDIQNTLGENDIAIEIVSYVANNHEWLYDSVPYVQYDAFIVDKEHTHPIRVGLCRENDLLKVYNFQPKSYSTTEGSILYHLIWDKLQPFINGKQRIFYAPCGTMSIMGIESLSDESGQVASEKYPIYRVSTTRNILNQINDTIVMDSILLYGGINYSEDGSIEHNNPDSLLFRSGWSFLSKSYQEVLEIENVAKNNKIDTRIFVGEEASEESFKNIASDFQQVIHIATHGFNIPENKRDVIPYYKNSKDKKEIEDDLFYSGLVFSNGYNSWKYDSFSVEKNDGILTAFEISKLNLSHTQLVVLSACETANGNNSYDGIVGLQRAFKLAGVKSLVMSLWEVDDSVTEEFMSFFYSKLIQTQSKRDAFRLTQSLIKTKYPDPLYWAAFILLD